MPASRFPPFVPESDSKVLDSDLWWVPRTSSVEDLRTSVPMRGQGDSLGNGGGQRATIEAHPQHSWGGGKHS